MSKTLFSLFATVALSASLAACGGGGGDAPAPSPAPTPIASVPPAPVPPAPAPTPSAPIRVAIYDAGLRQALTDNGVAVAADGTIDSVAAATQTQLLIEKDYGIVDLTGISAFTHLTKLHVWYNTSLTNVADVSSLTNLDEFSIYKGAFTSIDVSKMVYLETLGLTEVVGLNTVDTSKLTQLSEFDIQANCDDPSSPWGKTQGMTSIDVSHNASLLYLNASCQLFSSIDTSHNPQLAQVAVDGNSHLSTLDFSHNPMLVQVAVYGDTNLTTLNLKGTNGGQLLHRLAAWSAPNLTTIMVNDPTLYTDFMASAYHATENRDDFTIDVEYSQNANFAAGTTQLWIPLGVLFTQ
jgi:hypothetical protein